MLAGWKSADGKLHDYYFTFVNGAAIIYGLVPRDKANPIMDRLLAKMKEVGYTPFRIRPARRADSGPPGGLRLGHARSLPGLPKWRRDGIFAYFTLQALYQLGRRAEGDAILFPLLEGYEKGGFQGFGPNGKTYDWKSWDGSAARLRRHAGG